MDDTHYVVDEVLYALGHVPVTTGFTDVPLGLPSITDAVSGERWRIAGTETPQGTQWRIELEDGCSPPRLEGPAIPTRGSAWRRALAA